LARSQSITTSNAKGYTQFPPMIKQAALWH
jgi:hypothetical protein